MIKNEFLLTNYLIDLPPKIKKIDELITFISNKDNSPFSLLSENDLNKLFFDGEKRIYGDKIELQNKIVDVEELNIRNTIIINFVNCIFKSKIYISDGEHKLSKIYFDNCIFSDEVKICKPSDQEIIVSIVESNFIKLQFFNVNNTSVSISFSDIINFNIFDSYLNKFFTYNNEICSFNKNNSKIENYNFSFQQIKKNKKNLENVNIKLFSKEINEFLPPEISRDKYINNHETLDFLLENTELKYFRHEYAKIKYKKLLHTPNLFNKIFIFITGGFYKPLRFIVFTILFIFIFGFIYSFFEFNVGSSIQKISFYDCIYFSGVTFYTIGYGDITPRSIIKTLVLIESFCGVIINSSILIAFLKKYIE